MDSQAKRSFISIPTKQDFVGMVRVTSKDVIQAQCHLPCGQPCVCSCHVSERLPPQVEFRF